MKDVFYLLSRTGFFSACWSLESPSVHQRQTSVQASALRSLLHAQEMVLRNAALHLPAIWREIETNIWSQQILQLQHVQKISSFMVLGTYRTALHCKIKNESNFISCMRTPTWWKQLEVWSFELNNVSSCFFGGRRMTSDISLLTDT